MKTVRNRTGQAGQLMEHVGCARSLDFTLGASPMGSGRTEIGLGCEGLRLQ